MGKWGEFGVGIDFHMMESYTREIRSYNIFQEIERALDFIFGIKEGLEIDSNTYDACIDLIYNRGMNELTEEIIIAMAEKDDEKILDLFNDFDYNYALKHVKGINSEAEVQAYVDRNPGLKTRREEEYNIYKNGFDGNGDVIYED